MKDKITSIRLKEKTKEDLRKSFREFPRETDEDLLIKLIKMEEEKNVNKDTQSSMED